MPIYSYKCDDDHDWDQLEKWEDEGGQCPTCGEEGKRQVSAPRVRKAKGVYDEFL